MLLASHLLGPLEIQSACSDFAPGGTADRLDSLCSHLISKLVLTRWQCDKLRQGRYKGFRLDKYLLLDYLGSEGMISTFLARDVTTGMQVTLAVAPKHGRHE